MASRKEELLLEEILKEVRELKELYSKSINKELITPEEQISKEETIEIKVSRILNELGVPASSFGYDYCKEAVLMIIEEGQKIKFGYIYDSIAQKHGSKYCRVERNIRTAITKAALARTQLYEKIFFTKDRVVNSLFISTIAEQLMAGII